ncbi:porin family protein [Chryseobacterium suipulveris]|uniref:Porin family protein n=1 Tax=Chryseobacterium suipulveris TaxID=2929800 RepID=A0ABY4BZW6_9FLAO|nr:outer membrane beta-barrel protein [Chryseobacterium suipulveris]UOE42055.1 porin family protein [Chryseobacterium suipulveris]
MKNAILAAALLVSAVSFGQRAQKGEFQLNAGVALPSHYSDNVGLYAGFDYGIHKDITLGAEARFGGKDYGNNWNGRWFGIGINGNYHFNSLIGIPNNWDFYAGPTIGFNTFTWKDKNNNFAEPYKSNVAISAQVGGRYFITNNFALNAEANAGDLFNGGKFGITYKF